MTPIRKMCQLWLLVVTAMLLGACTSSTASKEKYSGFLSDYSGLQSVKLADGTKTLRWVSPNIKNKSYTKIYIDPVTVYPAPKDEKQVDAKLVRSAAAYLDQAVRQQLQGTIQVVDSPEPGALRLRAAITAVETPAEGFKAYEVIPIALVVYGVSSATGARDRNVNAYLEAEITDIDSNEVLGYAVKKGVSDEQLENSEAKVSMAQLKPTLDAWAKDAVNFIKLTVK